MDPDQYTALDGRLHRLEREAGALRAELTRLGGAGPAVSAPPPQAPAWVPPPAFVPAAAGARAPRSLEGLFAGRGLQLAGVFLVLLGTAFFLNLAFTNGWIGPVERIILGLVAGVALLGQGLRRHKHHNVAIAEGLIALGAGILYLSLWASVVVFPELHVPRVAAFAAMIAVTAVLGAGAFALRSERVALLGLIGGVLTPLLLSTGTPDRTVLAVYVLVLAVAFATLGVRARFRYAEGAAFVASALYLTAFGPTAAWPIAAACAVTSAICGVFAIAFAIGAVRDGTASRARLVLLAVDAFAFAAMLAWIFDGHATSLGIAYLILAAVFLAAARFVPVPNAMRIAYGYLGLASATLALPALLHRTTLADAFALEGAVLIALGARRAERFVAAAGAVILVAVGLWLVGAALSDPPAHGAFSALTLTFAITVAALVYVRTELARFAIAPQAGALSANVASVAANVVAIVGISRILLDALGGSWDSGVPSHAQFAISIAWTAYATALFGLGMRRGSAMLRREGLALFAVTIVKVFTIDLGNVDVAWRIGSFVVLGIVCLGVSAWYMRSQAAGKDAPVAGNEAQA
ncbi:MAG TPA: DUF2339 domain-containing protein [Candidatus Elarobacter sp.]|jgi:uncharacterized membrane protein|nr:DUF2339 domain-containing protein [Candidatus Elarobacter sp.]